MGIYLNGIHISRKLSTEKGNYAQLINRRNSCIFRQRNPFIVFWRGWEELPFSFG